MLTQVGEGAAEAVELPDDEHVARPERAHATVESRSVVYAGREVLVDVDGVDARSAAGTATGSRPPSRRGPRRSACVVNGRLRQTGEGSVRPAPPCSTHTSPRTTRSWPPCWRRNEPDTAAYRAHAGLERPGPLGERRARGRRLHCFVLANDVDTEAFAFTTRPRTHFKRAAGRKGIPKVPRFAGPSHWPAGYSRWHSVRENTNRLHVVPHHTTLKAPHVLQAVALVGARQGTQREQPRHEADWWSVVKWCRACADIARPRASKPGNVSASSPTGTNPPRCCCSSWLIEAPAPCRVPRLPRSGMRSTGSTRSISTGKTCKTLVVSILVPQERLWVDDLPASANLG